MCKKEPLLQNINEKVSGTKDHSLRFQTKVNDDVARTDHTYKSVMMYLSFTGSGHY